MKTQPLKCLYLCNQHFVSDWTHLPSATAVNAQRRLSLTKEGLLWRALWFAAEIKFLTSLYCIYLGMYCIFSLTHCVLDICKFNLHLQHKYRGIGFTVAMLQYTRRVAFDCSHSVANKRVKCTKIATAFLLIAAGRERSVGFSQRQAK